VEEAKVTLDQVCHVVLDGQFGAVLPCDAYGEFL
jgi:hypothetical protein